MFYSEQMLYKDPKIFKLFIACLWNLFACWHVVKF